MKDFGQTPLTLGRFTDDGGIIAVVGGAAFLFGFAVNPLLGAAIALAVANDTAASGRQKRLKRQADQQEPVSQTDAELEQAIATPEQGEGSRLNLLSGLRFTQVHPEVHPDSAGQKFTSDADAPPVDGWTERPWTPPAPDLSLLPIALFKQKVEGGNLNVEKLDDEQIREYATGRVWQYMKRFKHHDNIEYIVWFVFGLHKGKAQWYQLAADFCDCCRQHWLSGNPKAPPIDERVTW